MAETETDAIQRDAPDTDPVADPHEVQPEAPTEPKGDDPDNDPGQEEIKSPRQEAMDRIVGLREEEQIAEIEEFSGLPEESDPEKPPQTITVKVDGIEKEIPIDEAKAVVQKNMAADKRLNDASLKQQKLQQWEQQLVQREQQLRAKPEPQPPENTDDLKEQVQTAVDKLYDGDTDEAVEALTGLIEKRSNPATQINPDAIIAQAKAEVLQVQRKHEFEQEVKAAKKQFNDTFKELADVPELFDQADQRTITLMGEHPDWTPTQVIMEAGRQTQDFVNKIRGNGGNNGDASRMERKASLKPVPRSNGSINYQTKPADHEKVTSKQVINQMREARGQA